MSREQTRTKRPLPRKRPDDCTADAAEGRKRSRSEPIGTRERDIRAPALALEIMCLIANGVDSHGHPFLDERHRFTLAQTTQAWRAAVSSPSTTDAARLGNCGQMSDAWTRGRAASMSLIVERARIDGMAPDIAAAPYMVPFDPHRGEVVAWLATAPPDEIVAGFVQAVQRLVPTATEWYPQVASLFATLRSKACVYSEPTLLSARDLVRRNIMLSVCYLGRADVLDALLEWYDLRDLQTIEPCICLAVVRDDAVIVVTLLCHVTHRCLRSRGALGRESDTRCLLETVLAIAASAASLRIMGCLIDWGHHGTVAHYHLIDAVHGSNANDKGNGTKEQPPILHDRTIAERLRADASQTCIGRNWVPYAAATNRTVVFEEAKRRQWPYRVRDVMSLALVNGSLAVDDFVHDHLLAPTVHASKVVRVLVRALIAAEDSTGIPSKEAFARGMARLRERSPALLWCDMIDVMATDVFCRHLDFMEVILEIWPPAPNPHRRSPFSNCDLLDRAIDTGHWGVLSRVIKAHGTTDDGAAVQSNDRKWWAIIDKRAPWITSHGVGGERVVWTPDSDRATAVLSLFCRIAHLCGYLDIDRMALIDPDGSIMGDVTDADRAIDKDVWTRWCRPRPLTIVHYTESLEPYQGTSEAVKTTRARCKHILDVLEGIGLARYKDDAGSKRGRKGTNKHRHSDDDGFL